MEAEPVWNICAYGAIGDGLAKDTAAVQRAVDACAASGGGTVYCPPGIYLTGTIELKSHVEFRLAPGATLRGSTERADYTPLYLLHARGATQISIVGPGTIDGQGSAFFEPKPPLPPNDCHLGVRGGWRPMHLVCLVDCEDVLIRDVNLRDSSCYGIRLLGCERVKVNRVIILSHRWGPNTDGISPDCCRNVTISDCHIDTGDDCISVKTDIWALGRPGICENITVSNCTLITASNGIRIGFEGDGPIRNCVFSNLVIRNAGMGSGVHLMVPQYGDAGQPGEMIIRHGPTIENILFSNLVMDVQQPVFMWITDHAVAPGGIRNIRFNQILATGQAGIYLRGSPSLPVEDIQFSGMSLRLTGEMDDALAGSEPLPSYFWGAWKSKGIPHALYGRHIRGLVLDQVRVKWDHISGAWQSALRLEEVRELDLVNCRIPPPAPGRPIDQFGNVTRVDES